MRNSIIIIIICAPFALGRSNSRSEVHPMGYVGMEVWAENKEYEYR